MFEHKTTNIYKITSTSTFTGGISAANMGTKSQVENLFQQYKDDLWQVYDYTDPKHDYSGCNLSHPTTNPLSLQIKYGKSNWC